MASYPLAFATNDYALHLDQPAASSSHPPLSQHYPVQPFPGESFMSTFGYRPWWGTQSCLFESGIPQDNGSLKPLALDTFSSSLGSFHRQGVSSLSDISTIDTDAPSSPSDLSSSSSETGPSPAPEYVHAVCNAPLVAPVPLPYHSPTFLQFDLPDDDEDLSHPPYVSRPHKRKRVTEDLVDLDLSPPAFRRKVAVVSDKHNRSRNHRSAAIHHHHPMYNFHSGYSKTWQMPMIGVAAAGGGMPG